MTYDMAAFKAEHIAALNPQAQQQAAAGPDRVWERLEALENQWTLFHEGRPIICAGIYPLWPGRYEAWSVISERVGRAELLVIHRIVKRHLEYAQRDSACRRIEATARVDFPQAQRWLELLGFRKEGLMRYYDPEGNHAFLYARISHG